MQLDFQIILAKVRKDYEHLAKWVPNPTPSARSRKVPTPSERKGGTKKSTKVKADKEPEPVVESDDGDNWISAEDD